MARVPYRVRHGGRCLPPSTPSGSRINGAPHCTAGLKAWFTRAPCARNLLNSAMLAARNTPSTSRTWGCDATVFTRIAPCDLWGAAGRHRRLRGLRPHRVVTPSADHETADDQLSQPQREEREIPRELPFTRV